MENLRVREGFLEEVVSHRDQGKDKSVPDSRWGMCQADGKTEERPGEEKALSMDQIKNERFSLAEGSLGSSAGSAVDTSVT